MSTVFCTVRVNCVQFWAPHCKTPLRPWGVSRERQRSCEVSGAQVSWGASERTGLFNLEKRRLRGELIALHNYLKEGCGEVGVGCFSLVTAIG